MNRKNNRENLEKMMLVVLIAALAIVLGIVEAMLPIKLPIPGMKLGLANIMIVIGLYYLDVKDMLFVIILKTVLTTLLLGTFSMFFYGFVGAILSYIAMITVFKLGKNQVSLIQTKAIAYYMMLLLPLGLVTGVAVGIVAKLTMSRLNEFDLFKKNYKLTA